MRLMGLQAACRLSTPAATTATLALQTLKASTLKQTSKIWQHGRSVPAPQLPAGRCAAAAYMRPVHRSTPWLLLLRPQRHRIFLDLLRPPLARGTTGRWTSGQRRSSACPPCGSGVRRTCLHQMLAAPPAQHTTTWLCGCVCNRRAGACSRPRTGQFPSCDGSAVGCWHRAPMPSTPLAPLPV